MIPVKIKSLIPEVAQKLDIPQEHLNKMITYYYKENRKLLSDLTYLHIKIKGLGVFTIKGWDIAVNIKSIDQSIVNSIRERRVVHLTNEKKLYEAAQEKWEVQEDKKKQVRLLKKVFYENKELNESKGKDTNSLEE